MLVLKAGEKNRQQSDISQRSGRKLLFTKFKKKGEEGARDPQIPMSRPLDMTEKNRRWIGYLNKGIYYRVFSRVVLLAKVKDPWTDLLEIKLSQFVVIKRL